MKTREQEASEFPLRFLRDDVIEDSSHDKFYHQSIAKSLEVVIKQSESPLTLGLFGSWGAGKSSIVRILKASIMSNKKVAYIEFDVWKYGGDENSIRRQFIHSLYDQLAEQKLKGKASLPELMESSVAEEIDGGVKLDQAGLLKFFFLLVLFVGMLGALFFANDPTIKSGVALTGIILFIGFDKFLKYGLDIFKNHKKTVSKSQLTASDQFETEFRRVVDDCKAEKILVIVDNLDRATDENAITVLSTIKSFLEYKKCIYIVPCDDLALKKHLGRIFNDSEDGSKRNADEFLRKFFNTYLRIPEFINADMQDYTEGLLRETNFHKIHEDIQNLATVITSAYRENPRQVKQFINIFLSHFILADEREKGKYLSSGEITENPEFLAKILILQDKWPSRYEQILAGQTLTEAGEGGGDLHKAYNAFLESSSLIEEPSNIKAFLHFKQSSRATRLPGGLVDALETAIEDAKSDDVERFVKEILIDIDYTNELNDFFLELLADAYRTNRSQVMINIIRSLEIIWSKELVQLSAQVCQKVTKIVNDKVSPRDLVILDEEFVAHCMELSTLRTVRNAIIDKYLEIPSAGNNHNYTDTESIIKTIFFVYLNASFMSSTLRQKFNAILVDYRQSVEVLELISDHEELLSLLESPFLMELATGVSENDLNNEAAVYLFKSRIIQGADTDTDILTKFIDANRHLINSVLQKTSIRSHLGVILEAFTNVIYQKQNYLAKNEVLDFMIDLLIQGIDNNGTQGDRLLMLRPLLIMKTSGDDSQKSAIRSKLNDYIKANTASNDRNLLEEEYFDRDEMFMEVRDALEDMAVNDLEFAHLIWELGNADAKNSLMDRLLTHNPDVGMSFINNHIQEKDIPDSKWLANLILDRAPDIGLGRRFEYYEILNKVRIDDNKDAKEKLAYQIEELAKNTSEEAQRFAHDMQKRYMLVFSKQLRRQMSLNFIGWLEQYSKLNHIYIVILNMCFENFDVLKKEDKHRLYAIIFNQWLLQEFDGQEILRARELALDGISRSEIQIYIDKLKERIQQSPHLRTEIEDFINYIGSKLT